MIENEHLAARFAALGRFLKAHEALWKPRPFTHTRLGWESTYPELAQWLRQRSLAAAEEGLYAPLQLPAPEPFPALAAEAARLSAVGPLPEYPCVAVPDRLDRDVPGRKWQQIEAFARHTRFARQPEHWLDWCAGKGHLGRHLASAGGQRLTCFEHDPALVAAGQALSDHHHITAEHRCVDVLAAATGVLAGVTPVALHACGDLHVQLLRLAVAGGCAQLAVAPCCYNRTREPNYTPLSQPGASSDLQLDQDDLALPASEAVTAGARALRQRDASMARRLGFDLLQRRLRGVDQYLACPSLPVSWLARPFAEYCQHLAELKGLQLPAGCDWPALEAQGWARLAQVRNLELPRALFRRPLELWLALDRALLLRDHGYQVRLGTFCEASLTPRNLLIVAERAQAVDNSVQKRPADGQMASAD